MKKVITRKSAFSASRLLACLLCLLGLLLALFAFSGPFSTEISGPGSRKYQWQLCLGWRVLL